MAIEPSPIIRLRNASVVAYRSVMDLTEREKKHLLGEIVKIKGLMPLLMKPRNKQTWTAEDKAELRVHLQRLSDISPYLIVLALPGSFLMLPALAWWLDRRRNRQRPPATDTRPVRFLRGARREHLMWYVIGLIGLVLIVGIVWAYGRTRHNHAAARAKQFDALLFEAKRSVAADDKAGVAPPVTATPVVASPVPELSRKPCLLLPSDLDLYRVFKSALPDHDILAKYSLSDLVDIAPSISGYERDQKLRRLAQHKVDLVVCNRQME